MLAVIGAWKPSRLNGVSRASRNARAARRALRSVCLRVKQDDELVAADACDVAAGRQRVAQALGDVAQELVAAVVAERVVDLLETIEIE